LENQLRCGTLGTNNLRIISSATEIAYETVEPQWHRQEHEANLPLGLSRRSIIVISAMSVTIDARLAWEARKIGQDRESTFH
jgi:hypothetical protein